jgi:hypothetical protein
MVSVRLASESPIIVTIHHLPLSEAAFLYQLSKYESYSHRLNSLRSII